MQTMDVANTQIVEGYKNSSTLTPDRHCVDSYRIATTDGRAGRDFTDMHSAAVIDPIPGENQAPRRNAGESYRWATTDGDGATKSHTGSMSTVQGSESGPSLGASTAGLFDGSKSFTLGLEPCGCTKSWILWVVSGIAGAAAGLVLGLIIHFSYYNPMISDKMQRNRIYHLPRDADINLPVMLVNITYDDVNTVVQVVCKENGLFDTNDILFDFKKGWIVNKDRSVNLCFLRNMDNADLISYTIFKDTARHGGDPKTMQVINYASQNYNFKTRTLTEGETRSLSGSITTLCNDTIASWMLEPWDEKNQTSLCRTCLPYFHLVPFVSSIESQRKRYNVVMKSLDCPSFGLCL